MNLMGLGMNNSSNNFTLTFSKGNRYIFSVCRDRAGKSLVLKDFPVSLCKNKIVNVVSAISESFFLDKLRSDCDAASADKVISSWKVFRMMKIGTKGTNITQTIQMKRKEKCDRFIIHLPVFILTSWLFRKSIVHRHTQHCLKLQKKMAAETKSKVGSGESRGGQ